MRFDSVMLYRIKFRDGIAKTYGDLDSARDSVHSLYPKAIIKVYVDRWLAWSSDVDAQEEDISKAVAAILPQKNKI